MLATGGRLGCLHGSRRPSSDPSSQCSSQAGHQPSSSGRHVTHSSLLPRSQRCRSVSVHAVADPTIAQLRQRHRAALNPKSAPEAAAAAAAEDAVADIPDIEPKPVYLVEDQDTEGDAVVYELDPSEYELVEKVIQTDEILEDLDRVDVEASTSGRQLEVPATRLIQDADEMDLIGEGLPIINGVGATD